MLDIKFIRENPDAVKENIRKKFQNAKLPLVDEVIALDAEKRAAENEGNDLRAQRNKLSKQVGMLMGQAKKDPSKLEEAEAVKAQVKAGADRLAQLEEMEEELRLLQAGLERQRQIVTEASREVKKLEKLKEKQLEEYHRGEAKEQQETIAEHVAGNFVRRGASQ